MSCRLLTRKPTAHGAALDHLRRIPSMSLDLEYIDDHLPRIRMNSSVTMSTHHGFLSRCVLWWIVASCGYHMSLFQSTPAYPPGSFGARLAPTLEEALKLRKTSSSRGT